MEEEEEEEKKKDRLHMQGTPTEANPRFPSFSLKGERKTATIFNRSLLGGLCVPNGNLEEVLKHSYGSHIVDVSASNGMIHRGFSAPLSLSLWERKWVCIQL